MKFTKLFLMLGLVVALSACGEKSKKGAWVEADKKAASEFCNKEIGGQFPESMKKMIDMDKFCGCFVEKVEADFENFESVKSSGDKAAGETIGRDCAMKSINLGGLAPEAGADSTATEGAEEAPKAEEDKK